MKLKAQAKKINEFLYSKFAQPPFRIGEITDGSRVLPIEKLKESQDGYYTVKEKKRKEMLLKEHGYTLKSLIVEANKNENIVKLSGPAEGKSFTTVNLIEDKTRVIDDIETNNGLRGGLLSGDKHTAPSGGIQAIITDTSEPVLLEDGEAIINAKAVESKQKYDFQGKKQTTKKILSELNEATGGVPILETGGLISKNMKNNYIKIIAKNNSQLSKLNKYEDFSFADIQKDDIIILYTPDTNKYRLTYVKKALGDLFILFDKARQEELTSSYAELLRNEAILYKAEKIIFSKGGQITRKSKFSPVTEIDRKKITTSPEDFQGREDKFAKETVEKILNEGFDKNQDPIIVWWDENKKKYIVISGHSRWEASEILYKNGDVELAKMNAKIFLGDFDEAVEYAVIESNRSGTSESFISDVKAYKLAVSKGYNNAKLKGLFKPDSKLALLREISYLNENGLFLEHLGKPAEKSFPYLERNAKWVGNLRRSHGANLTDLHEKEMFDYFYTSKKGLDVKKENFFNYVNGKVSGLYYDKTKLLGLNTSNKLTADSPAQSELTYIRKVITELNEERTSKEDLLRKVRHAGDSEKEAILVKRLTDINKTLLIKHEKAAILEAQIQKAENTPMPDLFSSMTAPVTKKDTTIKPEVDLKKQGRLLIRELQNLRDRVLAGSSEAKKELRTKVRELQDWRDVMKN